LVTIPKRDGLRLVLKRQKKRRRTRVRRLSKLVEVNPSA
jgi:hypothetical protein